MLKLKNRISLFSSVFNDEIRKSLFHGSVLISGNFISQGIAFVGYPFISRIYSASQFGCFSFYMSIIGILSIIATGRLEYALILPVKEMEAKELKRIGVYWCFLFSAICFFVIIGINQLEIFNKKNYLFFWIAPMVLLIGLSQIFTFEKNRYKQYKQLAYVSAFQSFMSTSGKILIGLSSIFQNGLIIGTIFGQFLALIALSKNTWFKIFNIRKINWTILKKYNGFVKYRMPQALINTISSSLPIFFLSYYFSAKEAGYFALVFGVCIGIVNIFSSALYQVFYQKITEYYHSKIDIRSFYLKLIVFLVLIAIIPGTILFIFSNQLICVYFGNSWIEAGTYLKIILPWMVLVFIASPFSFFADIFSFQMHFFWIDILSLFIRLIALFIGLLFHSAFLSILLYSLGSMIVQLSILLWYDRIIQLRCKNFILEK